MERVLTEEELEKFLVNMDGAYNGSEAACNIWQDLKKLVNNESAQPFSWKFIRKLSKIF